MTEENEKKELRRKAEKKLRKAEHNTSELTHENALNLVHELQVHQVELEIQNEELKAAREDLSRARDRYRDLYDFAPVGYLTLSKHSIIREANITICQILGVKRENLLKRRLTEFIAPESQDEFYRHRRDILRTGKRQTCELVIRCTDGGFFWAAIDCTRDTDGLRVIVTDISSRKRAEEILRESEEKYRLLVETSNEGILVGGTDGKILWANQKFAEMLGYRLDDIIGKEGLDFMPKDQIPVVLQSREELDTKEVLSREYRFRRKDGSELWTLSNIVPQFDERGNHVSNFVMHTDITQRKQWEHELLVKDHALASAVAGIALADLEGKLTYVNPALLKMWGYRSAGEVLGKRTSQFITEANRAQEAITNTLEKGEWQGEFQGVRKDGSVFDIFITANLVKDANGKPIHLMASFLDITERKRAEQMKDEFLSLVSHELRTPLTVIKGSLQVAMDENASTEDVQELIKSAAENIDVLGDILENMLELTRHQTGRLQLRAEPVNLGSIANKVVDRLREYGAKQQLVIEMPEDLPLVEADSLRVERIFHNLIENAVKYSPQDSEIKVIARVDTEYLVSSVIDQGKGIPESVRQRLFQLFERLDAKGTVGGTGLGLVVCKRLVEAHGGWIKVESDPGKGATFSFGLPLRLGES